MYHIFNSHLIKFKHFAVEFTQEKNLSGLGISIGKHSVLAGLGWQQLISSEVEKWKWDHIFLCFSQVILPSFGVKVRSWSKNWPNCITIWVNLESGLSESGWFFWEICLGFGSLDGLLPPLGTLFPSWINFKKKHEQLTHFNPLLIKMISVCDWLP